jgi:putative ABC transport system permease protein
MTGALMTNLLADVRFAARVLARSPGFTAVVVGTLAIGIGATTALFSLVNAVLLRPLPFSDPHRLVEIWGRDDRRTGMRVPAAIVEALRKNAKALLFVGTHDPSGGVLRTADEFIDIRGETVSANFVDVFGVPPMAGRSFVADDERAGAPAVMLVSHAFWQRYLGASADAVGRSVFLGDVPYTVIGIMPPEFKTTFVATLPAAFWTPYAGSRSRTRERELGYELVARLAPGVTLEEARLEIEAIGSGVAVEEWRKTGRRIGLVPLKEEVVGDRAYLLTLLLAAVAMVLAVACANLAQLQLARSDQRLREFAARKAVGAGAGQLFRLAISESLLLSLVGGACGVVLAYWLVPLMVALAPTQIPRLTEASIDWRVLVMTLTISALTGVVFGLAPALRLSRLSVVQATKPVIGAASRQRARLRAVLVVVQVAGAVILCALAGLIVRTFLTLLPTRPGFATESRAAFIWSVSETQFRDVADRRRRLDDWMTRLADTPGIVGTAVGSSIPFGDDESRGIPLRHPDDGRPASEISLRAEVRAVSPAFLELLQIPLVRGRPLTAADRADTPGVVVVNQTLARRLDPSGNVLGRSLRIGSAVTSPVSEIVGVVADTRWWGMTLEPLNEVYTPVARDRASFGYLVVQTQLDAASATQAIRRTFHAAFPGAALPAEWRAVALDEMIGRSVAAPRFGATLIGWFSATAFVLAVIGLFGLVAYSVSQRRQELGIRAALGARPGDLIVVAVRSAIGLTLLGIAIGLACGAYATRFVESQLYGVEAPTVPTFAAAAAVMLVAAALAAYIPAHRAAHTDALTALRYE